MKPPAPPRVADHYAFWSNAPPEPSPRCLYWVARIKAGWRPNSRICGIGYDARAEYYGVYMWESLNIIDELIARLDGPLPGDRRPHDFEQAKAYGIDDEVKP